MMLKYFLFFAFLLLVLACGTEYVLTGGESSSSATPSSFSAVQSSSSAMPSSSSVTLSSSSAAQSSNSAMPSSSSITPSSSSISFCNGTSYNPAMQFCYDNSKVGDKCGNRTEIFDPDLYKCVDDKGVCKIYLKNPVLYGDNSYEAVLIGEQTWLVKNLNYKPSTGNSWCYKSDCDKYGRYYDWAAAMDLSSSCLSTSCFYILPRQGICPLGWHLPSKEEWDILTNHINKLEELMVTGIWGWTAKEGTDNYGFSALTGGYYLSAASNVSEGMDGYWWSASEASENSAYAWYIFNGTLYLYPRDSKSAGFSVRCLKDQ